LLLKLLFIPLLTLSCNIYAAGSDYPLERISLKFTDAPSYYASLQRGAKMFMDNCSGCHSLKYIRYKDLAEGIRIVDDYSEVLDDVIKTSMMHNTDKITDPILSSMGKDAVSWYGVSPPDLSLVARSRGVDWLYGYLTTYYLDKTKPWGVNNLVYPNVAMPHVLVDLEGIRAPTYRSEQKQIGSKIVEEQVIDKLTQVKPGLLTRQEYESVVLDIVNFLDYVGEPVKKERKRLGVWVLLFMGILFTFSYLLKKEYWKNIK